MLYFIMLVQFTVTVIMGIYFYRQLKAQGAHNVRNSPHTRREMDRLNRMRAVHLSEPLNERVRPASLTDIVGQDEGIRALKAVLCGENPQHVLLYGPPGVGKTCAARLVLEEAKRSRGTPFAKDAPFIEVDATCVRFDERSIADQLIGSVHDPIYQGAGQLGINGIPQPKEGAVTRAHGGVLFLDEIGEMHPLQMNKLLKVLEDRKVRFESAYYNPDDHNTPPYIHDIFQNGLPADFRLIGATTRSPEDMPAALRSRCIEIFFRPLETDELAWIARDAAQKAGCALEAADAQLIGRYAQSGRDAVSIVQMSAGVMEDGAGVCLKREDIEWVLNVGRYTPRVEPERRHLPRPGLVNALAVQGPQQGTVMEIEAVAAHGSGRVKVTGIVEEEQLGDGRGHTLKRPGTARAAAENALTRLRMMGVPVDQYDLHINFPGGVPVDGPSAGVAMGVAACSAILGLPVAADIAITGELSVMGRVLPVGGVTAKIEAARKAGLSRVLIPSANRQNMYDRIKGIQVISIEDFNQALYLSLGQTPAQIAPQIAANTLSAREARP